MVLAFKSNNTVEKRVIYLLAVVSGITSARKLRIIFTKNKKSLESLNVSYRLCGSCYSLYRILISLKKLLATTSN